MAKWTFVSKDRGGFLWLDDHDNGDCRPIASIQPAPGTAGHVVDTGHRIAEAMNAVEKLPLLKEELVRLGKKLGVEVK